MSYLACARVLIGVARVLLNIVTWLHDTARWLQQKELDNNVSQWKPR